MIALRLEAGDSHLKPKEAIVMTPEDYELATRAIESAMAEQRRFLEEISPSLLPKKQEIK